MHPSSCHASPAAAAAAAATAHWRGTTSCIWEQELLCNGVSSYVIFVFLLTPAPFSADTKNTLIPDFWHQNTHTLNFLTKGWTFWHRWQISGMPVCTLDFCFVYRWRHKSDWMSTLSVHFHGTTYPQCKSISCQMIINRSEAILENVQPNAKLEDKSTNEICIQPFCK